jgi:hypothetical protein
VDIVDLPVDKGRVVLTKEQNNGRRGGAFFRTWGQTTKLDRPFLQVGVNLTEPTTKGMRKTIFAMVLVTVVAYAGLFFYLVPVVPTPGVDEGGIDCVGGTVHNIPYNACWTPYEYSSLSYAMFCRGGTVEWAVNLTAPWDIVHTSYAFSVPSACTSF